MKPRIGAILQRGAAAAILACFALVSPVATASDETQPGPRPQAIAPLQTDPNVTEPRDTEPAAIGAPIADDAAPAEAAGDVSTSESQLPVAIETDVPATVPPQSAIAEDTQPLGAPVVTRSRESQLLAPPEAASDGILGSLDPRTNEVVRVCGALAVVIGLMLLLRMAAKRLGGPLLDGGRPSGVLLVLARYPIARGQSLVLLKLGRRLLLCHQSKGEMSTLCEIQSEDEVAAMLARIEAGSRGKDAAKFEKLLEDFNQEHRRRAFGVRGDAGDMRKALAQAPVIDLTRRGGSGHAGGGWLRLRRTAS